MSKPGRNAGTLGGEAALVETEIAVYINEPGGHAISNISAKSLWYATKGEAELRTQTLGPIAAGHALVRMLHSGISRGTERLVLEGRVPPGEFETMRCPHQQGDFPFPVKYGYCAVGMVEDGPAQWVGRRVFVLHPHQDHFVVPLAALNPLPETLPARRAILAANMETALNAVWDSGAGPGDRIAIVGAGVLGLLVAFICAGMPGADVTLADLDASRAGIAKTLGANFVRAGQPGDELRDSDIVFHTSASTAGLNIAIASAGNEGRIIEMSWFGAGLFHASLGGAFHSRRLQYIASQVGQIAATRRPRWDFARRLAKALALLDDARLDALITHEIDLADAPRALPPLLATGAPGLAICLNYPRKA